MIEKLFQAYFEEGQDIGDGLVARNLVFGADHIDDLLDGARSVQKAEYPNRDGIQHLHLGAVRQDDQSTLVADGLERRARMAPRARVELAMDGHAGPPPKRYRHPR